MQIDTNRTIDERTDEFLNVEEMARSLTSRLSRLDEEANRYSSASEHLSESAQAIRDLTEVVRELGQNTAEALALVASVGGPAIVERLSSIEPTMERQSEALRKGVRLAVVMSGTAAVLALAAALLPFLLP